MSYRLPRPVRDKPEVAYVVLHTLWQGKCVEIK